MSKTNVSQDVIPQLRAAIQSHNWHAAYGCLADIIALDFFSPIRYEMKSWLDVNRYRLESSRNKSFAFASAIAFIVKNKDRLSVAIDFQPGEAFDTVSGWNREWIEINALALVQAIDVSNIQPRLRSKRVCLFRQEARTSIDGKPKKVLTFAQYNVVEALIQAGDEGLTKDTLVDRSGHTGAREILTRLAESDDDWKSVIQFAGVTGGRYRIE